MWPALGEEWDLTPELYAWFDEREGKRCGQCESSLRSRQLAQVLLATWNTRLNTNLPSLQALTKHARAAELRVAEINSAANLHKFLTNLPNLVYSEFGSDRSDVRSEDLNALSYGDGEFEYVITSDTLEHVPDFRRALNEIRRVLKPGGLHIFTLPVIWNRQSRTRARATGGKVVHLLPPSFHGSPGSPTGDLLVFNEFGGDVTSIIEAAGFEVDVVRDSANPVLSVFVTKRRYPR